MLAPFLLPNSPTSDLSRSRGGDNYPETQGYGAKSYTFSRDGQVAVVVESGNQWDYTYDALGNLRHVGLPDGTQIEYVVDGENHRVWKKRDTQIVQGFVYSGALRVVAELDGSGAVVARFVYGDGVNVPDVMIKGGATYRILKDHLGSPRLVVDVVTGDIAQRIDYDAFGNVDPNTSTNLGFQPFGFAGGLYDPETKLVRFGARDYDAVTGRWTAKDPIRFGGGTPNLYEYVGHNPVNLIDPRGKNPALAAAAGALVGALIAFYLDTYHEPMHDAEETGLPGAVNGPQDAYRHCLASCVAAAHYGQSVAEFLSDLNEGDMSDDGERMDQNNNQTGREYCAASSDPGIDYCRDKCRAGLSNGDLYTEPF